jgi:hypothetical protein
MFSNETKKEVEAQQKGSNEQMRLKQFQKEML